MAKPITIPNTFAAATSAIPLSQLDQDFSTLANSTNDLATYSNYVADTGAADAYIANYPANTNTGSLTTGLRLQFKAANANTGASTLNVQVNGASIGTASIRLTDGSALPANTIVSGAMVDVMYDGTNFQLMNDPSGGQEVITNLSLSGNLTVTGTSTFTGNVTGNVVNTTTSTITNLSSGNVTITGGTISNVTLDNVTVDVETFSNITINGTATFAAGTVSAPSITTSGDTNTGIYFPAADTIAFTEGGVERMRLDSSGNLGLGVTPSAWSIGKAFEVGYVGSGIFTPAATITNIINNTYYSSGAYRYATTAAAAYFGVNAGAFQWFTAPSGTAGNAITFTQAMTLDASGNLLVGITSARSNAGDVQVSKGISFPATQSAQSDANTLDDYEEGTFTPTIAGETTTGTTTYTGQTGYYTKIGNQVTVWIYVSYSAATGTGIFNIRGLPFVSNSSLAMTGSMISNALNWSGGSMINPLVNNGTANIRLYGSADDGGWTPQNMVNEAADIYATITYFV